MHKNPGKAIIISACEQSNAGSRSVEEIWPALPRSAVPQYVTAQQLFCKQEQVYYRYIDISCQHVIWAVSAFPVSMSSEW